MDINTVKAALDQLEGGTFVGMDTEVQVKLLGGKKNPQQGRITKSMTSASVMCFTNAKGSAYDNMVKRRLEKEGKDPASFELGPRAWGQRITGTPFVEHNGKTYLEVIFMKAGNIQYLCDGAPIAEADIEGLPARKEATGQGGLDDQVQIRTFALDSIQALRAYGQEWK